MPQGQPSAQAVALGAVQRTRGRGPESCLTSRQAGVGGAVGVVWIQGSLWGGFEHRAGYWWGDPSVPGTLSLEPAWPGYPGHGQ